MSTSSWNESLGRTATISNESTVTHSVWMVMKALGSLKITVSMFAFGILILFVGTLAQDEETLVDVKNQYFNAWIAYTPLDVLLPVTIFPDHARLPFVLPLPGGALIGLILLINLVAAKMTRFSMEAKGGKLIAGVFFCILGTILIGFVVVGAHRGDGLQGEPPFHYDVIWWGCKASVWIFAAASLVWVAVWPAKMRLVRVLSWSLFAIFLGLSIFLIVTGNDYRIPDPGLRIVWQLTKSLLVGIVLLIGLLLLFGRKGGNVLIHLGVGLLMVGQFIFGDQQVEERITLLEGESTQIAYQLDTVELALIESTSDEDDRVIGVDSDHLEWSARNKKYIEDEKLPVDILVERWMPNHDLSQPEVENNAASAGSGLRFSAISKRKYSAAESEKVNLAAAYITFRDKKEMKTIGTFLFSQFLHDPNVTRKLIPESIQVGEKTFQLQFRFRNTVKPYEIKLEGVQRENYSGTMTPRDFSSDVHIVGNDGTSQQKGHIWMNNPMRFRGESFYQSSYSSAQDTGAGVEATTLQVVTNAGWLIPYVSCVICGLGMLVHFGGTFVRFASRYDRNAALVEVEVREPNPKAAKIRKGPSRSDAASSRYGTWIAIGTVVVSSLIVLTMAMPPRTNRDDFQWYEAGKIPMQHEGRIKPADTVARNLLLAVSNRSSVYNKEEKKIPATKWLYSAMANEKWVRTVDTIRIDSKEVLDTLGLKRRKGHRYSFDEVSEKITEVRQQLQQLDPQDRDNWTFEQKKLAELSSRYGILEVLLFAYRPLLPTIPDEKSEAATEQFWKEKQEMGMLVRALERESPPAIIPPDPQELEAANGKAVPWMAFGPAYFHAFEAKLEGKETDRRCVETFMNAINGIWENEPSEFNKAIRNYRELIAELSPPNTNLAKASWEAWYNKFSPVYLSAYLYVLAALIALVGFIVWFQPLRTSAFWLCLVVFIVHTLAIGLRVYISGRPPVVNLYSSAVFIGWAVVFFGLVVERLFPIGIGLLTGTVFGFLSLLVAYGLDSSDTMPVLQAVLDTQFWLATHVICITLGYGATFFAGAVGIAYLAYGSFTNFIAREGVTSESVDNNKRIIDRIGYGIICFGLFFSFIGTVLGGLWGDDSWGRFWGWDPKENGALMIVLWNALLIHARWDKMVLARGFAILSVFGNIVTAWSWFGTNQLGIGLHSYGFTKGILLLLAGFVISQLLIMIVGAWMTRPHWNSSIRS